MKKVTVITDEVGIPLRIIDRKPYTKLPEWIRKEFNLDPDTTGDRVNMFWGGREMCIAGKFFHAWHAELDDNGEFHY